MDADQEILQSILVREEETRLKVYDDASGHTLAKGAKLVGNPTIGTGRELVLHGISKAENDFLLANDMSGVQAQATKAFAWFATLDPVRKAIVQSMIFQLGLGNLFEFHVFLAKMQAKDYTGAADAGLQSAWGRVQAPSRAKREMDSIRLGVVITR